jgi:uncharacterized protein YjeT (DUF2065 family)
MEWNDLFAAFAIYLVLEGLLPFLSPRGWKQSLEQITKLTDSQLRMIGLGSMIAGVFLLAIVRS